MKKFRLLIAVLAIVVAFVSCSSYSKVSSDKPSESIMTKPTPIMTLPVSTISAEAREQFIAGLFALDMARFYDARVSFGNALELDTTFALAYLYLGESSASFEAYAMNIKKAEGVASNASREEQLLIEITRKGLDNDLESQLSSAMKLLEIAPESPRAYLYLADVQSNLNQHTEARQSIANAIVLAPNMVYAHSALGNLYLFGEPKDLDKAEQHFQMAADLVPTEPNPYDHLGDVYRAQGQFEKALDAYTKAGMYSGEDGSPFQQRGHVNSFLGNYDAARADYEKAIDMARGSQAATFGVFRAFVQVHAGDPTAAIEELKIHSASIGEMDGPELIESQIFSLGSAVTIALHHGMVNEAEELIADWSVLMRHESEIVGTDAYNRIQEAIIAYNEGMLAVKKGEYDKAEEKASEIAGLVESESNPRKMEPVNEIKGAIALSQGNFEEAADYFKMGDHNNNIYIKFQLANALEGAGQSESAFRLYNDVANWNFITIGGILTRKEAIDKVK